MSSSHLRPSVRLLIVLILAATPAGAAWPPSPPATLTMSVRDTAGVARDGEVVWSGVPLPRSRAVLSTAALAVVDQSGTPVPAQFDVLARWHAALDDTTAPIQWVLVAFPATVAAAGQATYHLMTDGSVANPPPAQPLQLTQIGDQVIVDTGAAVFTVGPHTLLDDIRLGDGTQVATAGDLTAVVDGSGATHTSLRAVRVERSGPLAAAVVVEGAYDLAPVGGAGLGSTRRYVFTVGSATAVIRHAVSWEGDRCGMDVLECAGGPNAVRVARVRDRLALDLGGGRTVTAVGDREQPAVSASVAAGSAAAVRQLLRSERLAPLSFVVTVPGSPGATGSEADGALLAVTDGAATVAAAIARMHRYEPQALRQLDDGSLAVDLVDDSTWLGNRQGLFATLAVTALPGSADRAELERRLWAPLNHPLRAWPTPRWWASSEAVEEIPVGALPADLAAYDTLVGGVLDDTLAKIDERGLAGLMTFGLYPRIWGHPWYTDELDCVDPTPGEDWDTAYWCGSWTDYHNAVVTAPLWAMRSGEVDWLDEIAVPGALRSLHTQVFQCAPGEAFFYCGQAPAGYGGYRADNNASHAYFDNLILHYWLSGDSIVLDTLHRGGETMRRFMCSSRGAWPVAEPTGPDGPACVDDEPIPDPWASVTGRVASQWVRVFRFLGLASVDPSFLEDVESTLARALTQYYVQGDLGGTDYGFLFPSGGGAIDPITGPDNRWSDQLWMASLYDTDNLDRWRVDSGDAALGSPALTPSSVETAWGRTLLDLGATLAGDGTAGGVWPNQLEVTWSGARIGGALASVTADVDPDGNGMPCDAWLDECLYDTGKAALTAALARAGDLSAGPDLRQMARDQVALALVNASSPLSPLNKLEAEFLRRLHNAVARLAWTGDTVVFSDGFESADLLAWSSTGP